jgi:hypothetical protein
LSRIESLTPPDDLTSNTLAKTGMAIFLGASALDRTLLLAALPFVDRG